MSVWWQHCEVSLGSDEHHSSHSKSHGITTQTWKLSTNEIGRTISVREVLVLLFHIVSLNSTLWWIVKGWTMLNRRLGDYCSCCSFYQLVSAPEAHMKVGPTASQRPLAVPSHVLQMKNSAIPSPTLQKAGTCRDTRSNPVKFGDFGILGLSLGWSFFQCVSW